jgi:DNA-binding NarL/FixJ family response regulator
LIVPSSFKPANWSKFRQGKKEYLALKTLKIVAVDDSPLIRDHLKRAFAPIKECVLVGMAADGDEALSMVHSLDPDILVLDISMPHRNGIQVLKEIREEDPEMVIIMFTADPSVQLREVCLEAGANYYLDKSQLQELLEICKDQARNQADQPSRDRLVDTDTRTQC